MVDVESLELVKTLGDVYPLDQDLSEVITYINAVAEAAGAVLVTGHGGTPEGYERLTILRRPLHQG